MRVESEVPKIESAPDCIVGGEECRHSGIAATALTGLLR